ncbi:MAG: hypothetical protein AAGF23_08955, partial [Acidobacteriota bacterium]
MAPLQEALAVAKAMDDPKAAAEVTFELGSTYALLRDPDAAALWIGRAAELHRRLGANLRALLEEALAAGVQVHRTGPIEAAEQVGRLRKEIAKMRVDRSPVQITGLGFQAGVFPPPLDEIVLRQDSEMLPIDGLGGVALSVVEGSLLDIEAGYYLSVGDFETAGPLLDHLAELGEREAGLVFVALAAMGRCIIAKSANHLDRALALCTQAVEAIGSAPVHSEVARQTLLPFCAQIEGALADVYKARGDLGQAVAVRQRAIDCAPPVDPCSQGMARLEQAVVLIRQGRFPQAAEEAEQGRELLALAGGCGGQEAQALAILAAIKVASGELGPAQILAEEAIRIAEASGHQPSEAIAWSSRLTIAQQLDDRVSIAIAEGKIARLDPTGEITGKLKTALALLACLRDQDNRDCSPDALTELATTGEVPLELIRLLMTPRSRQELAKNLKDLLLRSRASDSILEESQILALQAIIAFDEGRDEAAVELLSQAHRLYVEADLDPTMLYAALGQIQARLGRVDEASDWLRIAITRLERVASGLRSDLSRIQFFGGGQQVIYRLLIALRVDGGQTDLAFDTVEAASQRALLEKIAGAQWNSSNAQAEQGRREEPPTLALNEKIEKARQEIRRLSADDVGITPSIRENKQLVRARERLLDLLRRREEAAAELVEERLTPTVSLEETQRALAPGETLIRYFYLDEDSLIAWVVR